MARGDRGARGDVARGAAFFAFGRASAGRSVTPSTLSPATASAGAVASAAALAGRAAGFFFAPVVEVVRGFDGVFGVTGGTAFGVESAVRGSSDAGRAWVSPDSFDESPTRDVFAGSSGVSSGKAGGTVVTDPTYPLPVPDSRPMSIWVISQPVNTPSALLR